MAPKSKLTPELTAAVVEILREGNYADTAIAIVGIHKSTYYEWIKKGNEGVEAFVAFAEAVEQASAEAEREALRVVRSGCKGWEGSGWFLERRFPAKYAKREPDYDTKTKQLISNLKRSEVETATLEQKLEMLKAGQNPDGETITVVIPSSLKRDGE
jgi:transposase